MNVHQNTLVHKFHIAIRIYEKFHTYTFGVMTNTDFCLQNIEDRRTVKWPERLRVNLNAPPPKVVET